MTNILMPILQDIAKNGNLETASILKLRQAIYGDYIVSKDEAQLLINIDKGVNKPLKMWSDFYCETMFDFVINSFDGVREVVFANYDFLYAQIIDSEGRILKLNNLLLMSKIAQAVDSTAQKINQHIMNQIELNVHKGDGATKNGEKSPNSINESEVDILRQILHNIGGQNGATISLDEALFLQKIKDLVLIGKAVPSFKDLYVKAIANHLMAHNFDSPNSNNQPQAFNFFKSIGELLSSETNNYWGKAHSDAAIANDENISNSENLWLKNMFDLDGKIDIYEQAALDYIKSIKAEKIAA